MMLLTGGGPLRLLTLGIDVGVGTVWLTGPQSPAVDLAGDFGDCGPTPSPPPLSPPAVPPYPPSRAGAPLGWAPPVADTSPAVDSGETVGDCGTAGGLFSRAAPLGVGDITLRVSVPFPGRWYVRSSVAAKPTAIRWPSTALPSNSEMLPPPVRCDCPGDHGARVALFGLFAVSERWIGLRYGL